MALKHVLASVVSRRQALRIKYLNQAIYRLRTGKKKVNSSKDLYCISKPNTHVFFGYYDITPFNSKTDEIIYNNLVETENKLHLMKSRFPNADEVEIAETRAWNWQQGCRLRWMPNNDREVVFNDFDGEQYFARILNVDTKEERRIVAPLYDISPNGKYGLTIDFERLGVKRPGYGYVCRPYVESEHDLAKDSIGIVNLETNEVDTILTYQDIASIPGCETSDFKLNYLNHLCFSPSGRQFLFFWLTADTSWHKAYLLVHNLDTHETKLLESNEKVSHYVWEDEDNILCTACDDTRKWHYYRYTVSTGKKEALNPEVLNVDGHPSLYTDSQILTDTYPNLQGFQRLYICNKNNAGYKQLVEIYSNCMIEGEMRTDLHPRYNKDKGVVCFDSNQNKFRTLMIISLC